MHKDGVMKFKITSVPRQAGEFARLRVLSGVDVGATYIIKAERVVIGRGNEAQVVINDLKASRTHAKLEFHKSGWVLIDEGSANGIFYRGEFVRKVELRSGETFTLGESVFEFLTNQEDSARLEADFSKNGEAELQEFAFAVQRQKVKHLSEPVSFIPKPGTKPRNPAIMVGALVLVAMYLYPEVSVPLLNEYGLGFIADFLPEVPKTARPKKKAVPETESQEGANRALASYEPTEVSTEIGKTAEQYYRQGFREYRAGNYMRARDNFELAIQVNPGHELARYYLASVIKESRDEIQQLIAKGKMEKSIGRIQVAKGYYETAMRRMYFDKTNPDYIECEQALKDLEAEDKK